VVVEVVVVAAVSAEAMMALCGPAHK